MLPGKKSIEHNTAAFFKIKQSLASIFYSCLSPPSCQVKEHEPDDLSVAPHNNHVKKKVEFSDHIDIQPTIPPATANKIAQQCACHISKRREFRSTNIIANIATNLPQTRQYIIGVDDDILHSGMEDGSIPSTVADNACTLGVGTKDDLCPRTGRASHKRFILPGREIKQAIKVAESFQGVRPSARTTHHARHHREFTPKHKQICRHKLYNHL